MLRQLRGRNLAHVGLTIGLALGLTVGLVAALIIVNLLPVQTAQAAQAVVNVGLIAVFGSVVVLGVLGYWLGSYTSRRLWGDKSSEHKD